MPKDICIAHIEDEFPEMKWLRWKLRHYVEQFWNERDGGDNVATIREIRPHPECLVYDIACPHGSCQTIRYILVGPAEVPAEVRPFLCARPHFIIDVLRPATDAQKLWSTADVSVRSAFENGARIEDITLYTASQGRDLEKLLHDHAGIRYISKVNVRDLNLLLGRIVAEAMCDA